MFYLPDADDWRSAVDRLRAVAGDPVEPGNPYWARGGATFADPDGYRVTLVNAEWAG